MSTGISRRLPLRDKVAIVTGASGGIGQAVARRLAMDGAAVVIHYNSRRDPAQALASELADNGEAITASGDLSISADVVRLFDGAIAQFGGIDIVVANAGVAAAPTPFAEVSDDVFERVLNGNTRATFFVLRESARRVRNQGRIILIGSSTTAHPAPGFGAYAASKAADLLFTPILAAELGSPGITTNMVSAGPTDTGLLDNFSAEEKAALAKASPFGRLGTAKDTADVVAFLASDDARWLSGQIFVANGAATV